MLNFMKNYTNLRFQKHFWIESNGHSNILLAKISCKFRFRMKFLCKFAPMPFHASTKLFLSCLCIDNYVYVRNADTSTHQCFEYFNLQCIQTHDADRLRNCYFFIPSRNVLIAEFRHQYSITVFLKIC